MCSPIKIFIFKARVKICIAANCGLITDTYLEFLIKPIYTVFTINNYSILHFQKLTFKSNINCLIKLFSYSFRSSLRFFN